MSVHLNATCVESVSTTVEVSLATKKIHLKGKQFECSQYGKVYKHIGHLQPHEKSHATETVPVGSKSGRLLRSLRVFGGFRKTSVLKMIIVIINITLC